MLDIQGGHALIISKYALDCQPFHDTMEDVTWEECSLRTWLNESFISTAFSASERELIPYTTSSPDSNHDFDTDPGYVSIDRIFLLSAIDAEHYFPKMEDRTCLATEYAYENGAFDDPNSDYCVWWLRTPGKDSTRATAVFNYGEIYTYGIEVNDYDNAIRPAIWVEIEG